MSGNEGCVSKSVNRRGKTRERGTKWGTKRSLRAYDVSWAIPGKGFGGSMKNLLVQSQCRMAVKRIRRRHGQGNQKTKIFYFYLKKGHNIVHREHLGLRSCSTTIPRK